MKRLIAGIAGMFMMASGALAAPVVIDFSGFIDPFNNGPFTDNAALTGQITLDDSVVPTGTSNTFENVVLNFTLTVSEPGGPVTFTSSGTGGRVQQFVGAGGLDFITVGFGDLSSGVIGGTIGGLTMTNFAIDFRGADLFVDPTILATGLTETDFSFSNTSMRFDTTGILGLAVDRTLDTVTFSGEPQSASIAAPGGWGLLGLGWAALSFAVRRRRAQAPRS